MEISLASDSAEFAVARLSTPEFAGPQVSMTFEHPSELDQSLLKVALDRVVAALGLLVLSPILTLVAIAIKLDSAGPVLFRQERLGLGNRGFTVLKFRTMRANMSDPRGEQQTLRNDARVTRVGNFLRKTSIDELPQLFNVLIGEMSIVGPRPMALAMRVEGLPNDQIVSEYARRHRVKPGLTGWAQVNGFRGAVSTAGELEARVDYDLYYIDNWSIWLDLKIIIMTLGVFFGHRNAF